MRDVRISNTKFAKLMNEIMRKQSFILIGSRFWLDNYDINDFTDWDIVVSTSTMTKVRSILDKLGLVCLDRVEDYNGSGMANIELVRVHIDENRYLEFIVYTDDDFDALSPILREMESFKTIVKNNIEDLGVFNDKSFRILMYNYCVGKMNGIKNSNNVEDNDILELMEDII